jgi:transmembrane sensor
LGTSFNVNAYGGERITTSLVEGTVVAIAEGHKSVTLKPGYQAVFSTVRGFDQQPFDEGLVLSWMDGVYNFHDTQLTDITEIISNWYNIQVVIENPKRATENFTGSLNKKKPLKVFLDHLNLSSGVEARFSDGKLYLR